MADTLTYNLAGELLTESFVGGPLNGLSVTNGYYQFLRRTNLTALTGISALSDSSRFIMGRDRAFRRRTRCESDSCESCGSLARWI